MAARRHKKQDHIFVKVRSDRDKENVQLYFTWIYNVRGGIAKMQIAQRRIGTFARPQRQCLAALLGQKCPSYVFES